MFRAELIPADSPRRRKITFGNHVTRALYYHYHDYGIFPNKFKPAENEIREREIFNYALRGNTRTRTRESVGIYP